MSKDFVIIYDLDGTLVNSMPSISTSFRHTLRELGYQEPNEEQIRKAIGPGLHKALEGLLGSDNIELINKGVKIYRDYHDSVGYKATTFIPGMKELVEEISDLGLQQFVATMKANSIVRPIMEYLKADHLFVDMIGSNPEGKTKSKAEMLLYLSDQHKFPIDRSLLVGDTAHDANAAKEIEMPFFGITFGYGKRSELELSDWGEIFDSVPELGAVLRKFGK